MASRPSPVPRTRTLLLVGVCAFTLAGCLDELKEKVAERAKEQQRQEELARNLQPTKPQPLGEAKTTTTAYDSLGGLSGTFSVDPEVSQQYWQEDVNRENYLDYDDNPVRVAAKDPVSTFSVDVDTVSYANVRRLLMQGALPPMDAVRAEEMINYFDYDYAGPENRETPFAVSTEVAPSPWNADSYLVHIGIQGYEIDDSERPAANLVFLLDVSGSMDDPAKLPLLVNALKMMVNQLSAKDHVSIVVYAGAAGVVLEPTAGDNKMAIIAALSQLSAGGSTAGGEGIQLAYAMAQQHFDPNGINRVILATDGDFNVGVTDFEMLKDMVERYRETGIELTTLGFGGGNYNEALLEQLADHGNGNAFYIDTLNEARKVLVEELSSTLYTIAKDVKIQVEFNPGVVAEYRLIGYENRQLKTEDFKNDKVDAGDIGAGHTVTAIYEVVLVGSEGAMVDPLRYGGETATAGDPNAAEFAYLKLRYKLPGEDTSTLIEIPLLKADLEGSSLATASADFKFAAAVAGFAQLLRGGTYMGDFDYGDVIALARGAKGEDPFGYRAEFVQLAELAASAGS
jgi:Ca-activated chloride channel family protein